MNIDSTISRPAAPVSASPTLSKSMLWIMALAAGVGIANLYYNQPLLDQIQNTFHQDSRTIGWVPTFTQLGYALGMLLLVPLGDMLARKRLVIAFSLFGALSALAVAMSSSIEVLVAVSFVFGLSTMTPQLLVPFAAHLAEPERKGKVVGFMVSGILLGILLARTVAGFVGAEFGWRSMFVLAAIVQASIAAVLFKVLPSIESSYRGSYLQLLKSVGTLMRKHTVLREACLFGAMLFGSFMVFWSSLIHLMESPAFHLGPRAVGLYGLLGAAAALMSPVIGSLADKSSPRRVTGFMIGISILSYGIFYIGRGSLIVIGLGVLVMDLGVQLGHVTNQARIFKLDLTAQSRIQTAYMFCYFSGAALGSAFGAWAWERFGWAGVCVAATAMLTVAATRWLLPAAEATIVRK